MTLPPDLQGPVVVALARAEETIPSASSLPGGAVYELKWDGFRCALVRDDQFQTSCVPGLRSTGPLRSSGTLALAKAANEIPPVSSLAGGAPRQFNASA
jgi:hypothetical protein